MTLEHIAVAADWITVHRNEIGHGLALLYVLAAVAFVLRIRPRGLEQCAITYCRNTATCGGKGTGRLCAAHFELLYPRKENT